MPSDHPPRPLRDRLAACLDSFDIHAREPFLASIEAHYADDIVFRDPMQEARGMEAFLALNRRMGKGMKSITFSTRDTTGDDSLFYLYWEMIAVPRVGPTLSLEGVSRLRARDGRVFEHTDFWDISGLLASGVPGGRRLLQAIFRPFV